MLTPVHAEWLEKHGIDVEVAVRLGVQSADSIDQRLLCVPLVLNGKEVNAELIDPETGERGLMSHYPLALFNGDVLTDKTLAEEPIVILSDTLECVAAVQAGFVRSVAVPGGRVREIEYTTDIASALREAKEIILAGAADERGDEFNAELARLLGPARCKFLRYPRSMAQLLEVCERFGSNGVAAVIRAAKPFPLKGVHRLSDYPPPRPMPTFKTEWSNLDYHLKLWRGEFLVVGGIPSSGKSTWTLCLAAGLARMYKHRIAVCCFEDAVVPDIVDLLRDYMVKGGYCKTIEEADAWIEQHFVFFDQSLDPDEEEISLEWIIETARDCVERYQIDWLLIDPWNEIEHKRNREETGEEYQGRAIRTLKAFAKSCRVGVIVVTHPTKDVRDRLSGEVRTPGLYDLAGSAHWSNKADHGVIIHRPSARGTFVEVIVEKSRHQRYGGKPGSKWLKYDERIGGFRNCKQPTEEELEADARDHSKDNS